VGKLDVTGIRQQHPAVMQLPFVRLKRGSMVLFAVAVLLCGSGCQTDKPTAKLGGGYEQVIHSPSRFNRAGDMPRLSLQYRNAQGAVTPIWPALSGPDTIIKGNTAIFVGDKAVLTPQKNLRPRLFAVTAPALPLDITDEVLWRWTQANGVKFDRAAEQYNLVIPEEKNGQLLLHLEFLPAGDLSADKPLPEQCDLSLTWPQVAEIMRTVKTKGVPLKDLRWQTPYIGEVF
jgi:hypothetical protein